MTAQCEGMGEVGSARYEPALLPPYPSIRVLSYSNCQEIHSRQQTGLIHIYIYFHKCVIRAPYPLPTNSFLTKSNHYLETTCSQKPIPDVTANGYL